MVVAAITAAAMGGAHSATAIGFVSAFSRLPVHPANTKANSRAMVLIRAIPFCQGSKQERCPANGMLSRVSNFVINLKTAKEARPRPNFLARQRRRGD